MTGEFPEKKFRERVKEAAPLMAEATISVTKWVLVLTLIQQYPATFLQTEKLVGMMALGAVIGTVGRVLEALVGKTDSDSKGTERRINLRSLIVPGIVNGVFWPWGIADGSAKLARSAKTLAGRYFSGKKGNKW